SWTTPSVRHPVRKLKSLFASIRLCCLRTSSATDCRAQPDSGHSSQRVPAAALVHKLAVSQRVVDFVSAVVVIQHSAESLAPSHSSFHCSRRLRWDDETIIESLVIPLLMPYELSDRIPQCVFAKEDHLL